jgi:SAM-dependent methyltransferase
MRSFTLAEHQDGRQLSLNTEGVMRNCPICNQHTFEPWLRPQASPGPIVQCLGCGFIFVNPIEISKSLIQEGPVLGDYPAELLVSDDLLRIKGSWEEPIIETHLSEVIAKQANAKEYVELILDILGAPGRLLDIGSFCGVFLSIAQESEFDCYGIEPLVMPSIYARGRYDLNIITDTLHKDTFPPEFFDAVTAFQVFEHLIDPAKEIRKIREILKPGGLLVIEVPRIDTFLVRLMKGKHRHFVEDHVSFFTASSLGKLLRDEGFQVLKVFFPARTMSLRHLGRWIEKYIGSDFMTKFMPKRLLDLQIRLSLRDIICVISRRI